MTRMYETTATAITETHQHKLDLADQVRALCAEMSELREAGGPDAILEIASKRREADRLSAQSRNAERELASLRKLASDENREYNRLARRFQRLAEFDTTFYPGLESLHQVNETLASLPWPGDNRDRAFRDALGRLASFEREIETIHNQLADVRRQLEQFEDM